MTVKTICLTIDNGPDPRVSPRVLDILAGRGVTVTFFLVGENAARPEGQALAARALAEGHQIGNHTWSHAGPLGRMGSDESVAEIARTQAAIDDLTDERKLFRPVGGGGAIGPHLLTRAAYDHLVDGGYTCVLWNSIPGDFSGGPNWVERAVEQCDERHAAGETPLVVLHDVPGACVDRLDEFLGLMADAGWSFTPDLPDSEIIIDRGRPRPRAESVISDA